jgi:hypothetical protein
MSEERAPVPDSPTPLRIAVVALLVLLAAGAVYAFREHNLVKHLSVENSVVTSSLNAARDEVQSLTSKLNDVSAEPPAEKPAPSRSIVYRKPLTAASHRQRIESSHWSKVQAQLDEQQKQIASTREDLMSARTELGDSIARTHDELLTLEKKGERSYYEFDVDKDGQFKRQGPVGIRLRKANTKHEYADLELMVDDFRLSKKHVNVYEPVVFYLADHHMPVELVINGISKNHIHGYVSEPKYKSADLQATGTPSGSDTIPGADGSPSDSSVKPSPARQKLPPLKTN